ncbi:unnamed protein product [Arabis nemorensis]|uniref:Uncharacterized protein n=1 Tax=Arabis nemorensis TaxID=586526 RepID=A0A565CCL0_9BRAS|nr:unnamed protein product [Arabis nemorensis]
MPHRSFCCCGQQQKDLITREMRSRALLRGREYVGRQKAKGSVKDAWNSAVGEDCGDTTMEIMMKELDQSVETMVASLMTMVKSQSSQELNTWAHRVKW